MSDDLMERLNFCAKIHPQIGYPENGKLFAEAADRIEALQAERDAAVLDEREACAQVVEGIYGLGYVDAGGTCPIPTNKYVSTIIRARSDKGPDQ